MSSIAARLLTTATGVVLGLAVTVGVLALLPREIDVPTAPAPFGGPPLAEATGAITLALVHYVPELESELAAPYADFLGTLPPRTRLVVIVPSGTEGRARQYLSNLDREILPRAELQAVAGPISPWSKDRALVLAPSAATAWTTLLVPTRPPATWPRRQNDWRTVFTFAQAHPEAFAVQQLPLDFDAGDFAMTGRGVLVDANLVAKNRDRGIDSGRALARVLEPLLGRAVLVLGARDGDVPRHHLSMYLAPLGTHAGREVVLVGDPRLGRDLVGPDFTPGERDPESGAPLRADFSSTTIARHERAAVALRALGFEVVRIPTVPFLDKTYMAYTNGVFGTWGAQKIAWMPTYDLPALDARARATYEALGWEVRPVRVRSVYRHHGTIGCLTNVLARSAPADAERSPGEPMALTRH